MVHAYKCLLGGKGVLLWLLILWLPHHLNGQDIHKSCLEGEIYNYTMSYNLKISSDPIRVCKLEVCKLGMLFVCALLWQYGCELSG